MNGARPSLRRGAGGGILLVSILFCAILAGCAKDGTIESEIKGQKADYDIGASTLYRKFQDNQNEAIQKYKGRIIVVSGRAVRSEAEFNGGVAVTLNANDIGTGIQCLFASTHKAEAMALKGDVSIKGKCDGWNMGVVLRGCTVE